MRRLSLLLAALLLVTAVACGKSAGATAATVNGTEISAQTVFDDMEGFASSPKLKSGLEQQGLDIYTKGEQNYSTTFASAVLTSQILDVFIQDELAARGESVSAEDTQKAEQQFDQAVGTDDVSAEFRQRQIDALAAKNALVRVLGEAAPKQDVTDQDVRRFYDENPDQFTSGGNGDIACASHILVAFDAAALQSGTGTPPTPTPEQEAAALAKAQQLLSRIRAGEDFATVARQESDDTDSGANGGSVSCTPRDGSFVKEFEDALFTQPVGQVGEPVRSDFGYHLILVTSRGEKVPFEEIESKIREYLEQQSQSSSSSALDDFLTAAFAKAEVDVDPKFGTWDGKSGRVVPPEGPSTPTTPASEGTDDTLGLLPGNLPG